MSTGGLQAPGGNTRRKPVPKKTKPKPKTPWGGKDQTGVGYTPGYVKPASQRTGQRATDPYNPLGSSFGTVGDFNKAVNLRTNAQIDPLLQETDRQREREVRAHAGRQADIQSYFGYYDKNLQQAADNLRRSLADVSAQQAGTDQNAQATLRAALMGSLGQARSAADTIAGQSPVNLGASQDQVNSMLTSQAAGQQAGDVLAQQGLARQQAQDQALNVSGASRLKYMGDETARDVAKIDELNNDRRRIYLRRPELSEAARKELQAEEIQKQNLRFQQKLARDQFGETQKNNEAQRQNLSFQQWMAKQTFGLNVQKYLHQSQIDWANVHINEAQVQNQAAALDAQINKAAKAGDDAAAKERAQSWVKGLQFMNTFLAPAKGEGFDGAKYRKRVTYESLWRQLVNQQGMNPKDALRLMTTIEGDSPTLKYIRNRAKNGGHRGVGKIPYLKPDISGSTNIG